MLLYISSFLYPQCIPTGFHTYHHLSMLIIDPMSVLLPGQEALLPVYDQQPGKRDHPWTFCKNQPEGLPKLVNCPSTVPAYHVLTTALGIEPRLPEPNSCSFDINYWIIHLLNLLFRIKKPLNSYKLSGYRSQWPHLFLMQ